MHHPGIPYVTVILPFYNSGITLQRSIESIARQSFEDFECILINNNSTDESHEIALNWTENDDRFKLIHEKKQGVMFASNKGAAAARGKYIARMDADDWAFKDRLERQVKYLDQHIDVEAVSGTVDYIPHEENTEGFKRFVDWSNSILSYKEIYNNRFVEFPIVNPTLMWRKEVGLKFGLYDSGDFPEDYEMFLRWISRGVKIEKIPDRVIKWYDSISRLTRTNSIYRDEAFFRIKSEYLAEWLRDNNPNHPEVLIWGASKISRKRAAILEDYGIEITAYVDVKKGRQLQKPVIYFEDLESSQKKFLLIYLKEIQAKSKTQEFLDSKGFRQNINYLLVS